MTSIRILRYSFMILFLWFGYHQLMYPEMWTGFLPEWIGYFPIPAEMIIQLNGWFEVVAALFLGFGIFTRIIASLLAVHLFMVAVEVEGAIGMRDAVLAMIGVALATSPADPWTLDFRYGKTEQKKLL